jgi:transcriptional regulator with XRE-family HTH domain
MIFPVQISAARVLLGLSQLELARLASVSIGTIKRIEAERDQLAGTMRTMSKIQRALEVAGVVFIEQDGVQGPGVRLRAPFP